MDSAALGSLTVTTNEQGLKASKQEFDPWGNVRAGDVPETTLDYTGQRRDTTGLRYYNARYYDPVSGHFISADTIVPGAGALTMAPNDSTAQGLWGTGGNGPANPQDLNRYSYVNNNPVRNTDPTGHAIDCEYCGGSPKFAAGGSYGQSSVSLSGVNARSMPIPTASFGSTVAKI